MKTRVTEPSNAPTAGPLHQLTHNHHHFKTMAAFCLLSLVLAYVGVVYTAALPPTVVDLGYAQYSGTQTRPGTVVFLGIPYAEPPVGQLRFRKPNPLDKNRVKTAAGGKAVDAASYKPFCIQGAFGESISSLPLYCGGVEDGGLFLAPGDRGGAGSEDCLDVDVYKPTTIPPGKRLPVLVYIHVSGIIIIFEVAVLPTVIDFPRAVHMCKIWVEFSCAPF